jgi:isopropylmalate/homocitrate/citramalate synthase
MKIPEDFWITDTTFRDGQQSRPIYTPDQIADIYDLLHELDNGSGIIRQSEFFLYSKNDRDAVSRCKERGYDFPQVTGWIRATKRDFRRVIEAGLKETGFLTSVSDYLIFHRERSTRGKMFKQYLDVVEEALKEGVVPRCHFEDVTRADYFGFVVPLARELMGLSERYNIPVKIRLCDTMGVGVSNPAASLPRCVPKLVHGLVYYGVPSECLEWHSHDDLHVAKINASTAWQYGCSAANVTVLGLGERAGNTCLADMVIEHGSLKGSGNTMNLKMLGKIAKYYKDKLGVKIPENHPLLGKNVFRTAAAIHLEGISKGAESGIGASTYEIFDPQILGNRRGIIINNRSGIKGIAIKLNELLEDGRLELGGKKTVDEGDRVVIAVTKWVLREYDNERTTTISDDEILAVAKETR